ncbi:hypothetical protein ANA_C20441 [Anabaena sp. 90]|nr:hypothetical protein ANA_C20441 [Anabaena sp. 90]
MIRDFVLDYFLISLIKRMFEKWYSVIFITLLPPLVPPLQGGKQ